MEEKTLNIMPVLPVRGLVLYPNMVLHFEVSRKMSKEAVEAAMNGDRAIFIVSQKNIADNEPKADDLSEVGTIACVKQMVKLPNTDLVRVVVEGCVRGTIESVILSEGAYILAAVEEKSELRSTGFSADYETALVREAKEAFEEYAQSESKLPPDIILQIVAAKKAGELADCIAANTNFSWENKQLILQILNPVKRLEKLLVILTKETKIVNIEREIQQKVQENVDKGQREYYLREQLKVISDELGDGSEPENEVEEYKTKIKALNFAAETEDKLIKEAEKLGKMTGGSQDAYVIRNYLDTVLSLPWNKFSQDNLNIKKARTILNRDHYGIEKVKERILEIIALRAINPNIKGQIVCLAGPPGVGKTSIAHSLAEAMGRKYARISLGGVHDEAEIRGHRRTYIGAMQGKIISAVKSAGTSNPLILLDEIDKLGSDYKGDPASAMLEVLDSEQNSTFTDNFIDIPYDLSRVFFITTANDVSQIPEPLYDRMEIIELSSYTADEKFHIAKKHLFKKQLERSELSPLQVKITDEAIRMIIEKYTSEAGVRELERVFSKLMRKAAMEIIENGADYITFSARNLKKYLGTPKYKSEDILSDDWVGIVNGLAWTSVGGKILRVEVNVLDGTGKIELTGSLGDVMKESCNAALSFIRSIARKYNIPNDFYKTKDIHIHFPAGATPKDGPSAGIAIATAVLSALTGTPVRRDIAMTGEITLKGRVLPIGGLREKTMGAYVAGVHKVIIPKENIADLDEVEKVVKDNIEFVSVDNLYQVFSQAFVNKPSSYISERIILPKEKEERNEIRQ